MACRPSPTSERFKKKVLTNKEKKKKKIGGHPSTDWECDQPGKIVGLRILSAYRTHYLILGIGRFWFSPAFSLDSNKCFSLRPSSKICWDTLLSPWYLEIHIPLFFFYEMETIYWFCHSTISAPLFDISCFWHQ